MNRRYGLLRMTAKIFHLLTLATNVKFTYLEEFLVSVLGISMLKKVPIDFKLVENINQRISKLLNNRVKFEGVFN